MKNRNALKMWFVSLLAAFALSCAQDPFDFTDPYLNIRATVEAAELESYPRGISRIDDGSIAFCLFAPGKTTVHLIGEFNDWTPDDAYLMAKGDDDCFRIALTGLDPDREYVCQYLIDLGLENEVRVADPYCYKISDPENDGTIPPTIYPYIVGYPTGRTNYIAMTVSSRERTYEWRSDEDFEIDNPYNMVVYELLIRDFTEEGSIRAATERIPYLKTLGVTAVELMPFNEFEGNDSWGYNPTFFFATDKAYGTDEDYKAFIDECHENGIGVIMDIVLNHCYGQGAMVRMYQDAGGNIIDGNPWFNRTANFENTDLQWGFDFNHESPDTKEFVQDVLRFWMEEFRVDGFRFDFTKGFSNTWHSNANDPWGNNYDRSRIDILTGYYDYIRSLRPNAPVIFEHLADNAEETELANRGIQLWGNFESAFSQCTMGWSENHGLSWATAQARGWWGQNLLPYMESHDEERTMFKNLKWGNTSNASHNVRTLNVALQRNAAAAVLLMSIPGSKMIWQFGELGYEEPLYVYEGDIQRDKNMNKMPVHWEYVGVTERLALYNVYAAINTLKTTQSAFTPNDYWYGLDSWPVKQITLSSGSQMVAVAVNFDVQSATDAVNFGSAGTWTEYFSQTMLETTGAFHDVTLGPGEYRVYIK